MAILFIVPFLKINKLGESKSEEFVFRADSDRYCRVQVEGEKVGKGGGSVFKFRWTNMKGNTIFKE